MRRIAILLLWLLPFQQAFAYPEYPPFERTRFATEHGMFRWYRGCWFRVLNVYVYIICDPSGEVIERTRRSAARLTGARGDGISLSDYYGGHFSRSGFFSGSDFEGGSGFPFAGQDDGTQRIFGENVPTSDGGGTSGVFSGGDGFFSSGGGTRMHDVFDQPVGFGCDDIHDSIDGGLFGPIPCTSYPGVFGPKVEYGR